MDAAVAPALGKRVAVMASWSRGERWVLAARASRPLRGARLALQAPDARASKRLVAALLRGEPDAATWSRVVGAPVTADARQLVVRSLADVVAVPARLAGDLTVIGELGRFHGLALVSARGGDGLARAAGIVKRAVRAALGGTWTNGRAPLPAPAAPARLVAAPPPAATASALDTLNPVARRALPLPIDELWIDADEP